MTSIGVPSERNIETWNMEKWKIDHGTWFS